MKLNSLNLSRNEECLMRRIVEKEAYQKMTEGIRII